ncbi:WD-40 repeat protein [Calothrix sp. NIES-2100]|uniref:WD40 repeat domain-containing protein n=1 Tax=Calothrix sp. NIES-2100 TaxID=1954172 RepID=UPI000B5E8912|nr:WD-40 repeat protein [Calothrix sp. NIES-2100]
MPDNQPKEYDAVLGGQLQVPVDGVVLGGIEGVKKRLALKPIEPRLAALKEALKYGDAGLDLIIEAFQHQPQLKQFAYTLLSQHPDSKAKQLIEKCNQYEFFQCIDSLEGHQYEVGWVRFSSDGKKFISVSKDLTIKVWDLHTERVIQNIETHVSKRMGKAYNINIAFSSNEKIICISTKYNSEIEVWNVNTRTKVFTLEGRSNAKNNLAASLAISADGKILFNSEDNYIKFWDLQTGDLLRSFE